MGRGELWTLRSQQEKSIGKNVWFKKQTSIFSQVLVSDLIARKTNRVHKCTRWVWKYLRKQTVCFLEHMSVGYNCDCIVHCGGWMMYGNNPGLYL